jgi:hypothetical protein
MDLIYIEVIKDNKSSHSDFDSFRNLNGRYRLRDMGTDNKKTNLNENEYRGVGCIILAQYRNQWRPVLNTEASFFFSQKRGIP